MIKISPSVAWRSMAILLLVSASATMVRADDTASAPPSKQQRQALTEKEQDALDSGPISTGRWIAGAIVGTVAVPFGVGQAIQGRYTDTGFIFTITEGASVALLALGIVNSTFNCSSSTLALTCNINISPLYYVGLGAFVGFWIWDVVDLWSGPPKHNRLYRQAKAKSGGDSRAWTPFVAPTDSQSLALGLQLRF